MKSYTLRTPTSTTGLVASRTNSDENGFDPEKMSSTIWNYVNLLGLVLDVIGAVGLTIINTNTVSHWLMVYFIGPYVKTTYNYPIREAIKKLERGEPVKQGETGFNALIETISYGPDARLARTENQEIEIEPIGGLTPISVSTVPEKDSRVVVVTGESGTQKRVVPMSMLKSKRSNVIDQKLDRIEDYKSLSMTGILAVGFALQAFSYYMMNFG